MSLYLSPWLLDELVEFSQLSVGILWQLLRHVRHVIEFGILSIADPVFEAKFSEYRFIQIEVVEIHVRTNVCFIRSMTLTDP